MNEVKISRAEYARLKAECKFCAEAYSEAIERIKELENALNEAANLLDGNCDDEGNPCSNADAAEYRAIAKGEK